MIKFFYEMCFDIFWIFDIYTTIFTKHFTYIHNNPFFIKAWSHNIGQVKCVHLGKWKEVAEEHAND